MRQTISWTRAMVLAFLLLGAHLPAVLAQRLYADRVVNYSSTTTNPNGAVDGDPSNQATLAPSLLLGGASLRLGLPGTASGNQPAGVVLNTGGLLTAAALGGIVISTYKTGSSAAQQRLTQADVLRLGVLNGTQTLVEFTAANAFDQIQVETGGLVNGGTLGVAKV